MVLSFLQGHSLCLDKSGDSKGLAGRPLEGLIQSVLFCSFLYSASDYGELSNKQGLQCISPRLNEKVPSAWAGELSCEFIVFLMLF